MRSNPLFVGLISGTSADAIDVALVECAAEGIQTVATLSHSIPTELSTTISAALKDPAALTAQQLGRLDAALGDAFADAVLGLCEGAGLAPTAITAIGSHGQTLYHGADQEPAFTLQVGDPARIATRCATTVVADFRRADIAAGGEGAPLAPLLHAHLMASASAPRVIVNLGGIANISLLVPGLPIAGYDTGPANGLMDAWSRLTLNQPFDRDGRVAADGQVDEALLERWLTHPYFARPAPKSTGREQFHQGWLLEELELSEGEARALDAERAADVMATLCALSARTIADGIERSSKSLGLDHRPEIYCCGGGVHNPALMTAIAQASGRDVASTSTLGIDPDFVEAVLFAWLAAERLAGRAVDTRTITGARRPVLAGAVHEPPQE